MILKTTRCFELPPSWISGFKIKLSALKSPNFMKFELIRSSSEFQFQFFFLMLFWPLVTSDPLWSLTFVSTSCPCTHVLSSAITSVSKFWSLGVTTFYTSWYGPLFVLFFIDVAQIDWQHVEFSVVLCAIWQLRILHCSSIYLHSWVSYNYYDHSTYLHSTRSTALLFLAPSLKTMPVIVQWHHYAPPLYFSST